MSHGHPDLGITDQPAPELGVTRWVDAAGRPLADYGLQQMPGAYKVVFCFQDACPGCHVSGFPTLAKLVDAFRGSSIVSFVAVQTVFEEFEDNSYERMLAARERYALGIPFGHDAGEGREDSGSVLMQRFRNGGTPWFIVVDPDGVVIYNHFGIEAERLIDFLNQAAALYAAAGTPPQAAMP